MATLRQRLRRSHEGKRLPAVLIHTPSRHAYRSRRYAVYRRHTLLIYVTKSHAIELRDIDADVTPRHFGHDTGLIRRRH